MRNLNLDFETRDEVVYLDNAATTEMDDEVVEAMQPYLEERFGNAETPYALGQEASDAVEEARERVAALMGCDPSEVFFTSGGTESNNWAIKGSQDGCIVISQVEHASVLEPTVALFSRYPDAYTCATVGVDKTGTVNLKELKGELENDDVSVVSIQYANNEVGTIQPVRKIAKLCQAAGVPFHTDACQAAGKIPVSMEDDGFDMASVSAHKIHGPMGIGALCIKEGTKLEPLLHGGGHEEGRRSGTLAVAQIVGFGKAAELARVSVTKEMSKVRDVAKELIDDLRLACKGTINGHPKNRLPTIVSVTFPGVEASLLCGILEAQYGFCVSTGAACATRKKGSHVLEAMGLSRSDACSTVRVSLSKKTTLQQIKMLSAKTQASMRDVEKRSLL